MAMTRHRHPLLSRWLLATRYLKAQKNLHHNALYNALPENRPRLSRRGRPPLPDGAIDPPLPED
ncbi:hypothetical protein V8E54_006022 [Elaphomyces granulatus]